MVYELFLGMATSESYSNHAKTREDLQVKIR